MFFRLSEISRRLITIETNQQRQDVVQKQILAQQQQQLPLSPRRSRTRLPNDASTSSTRSQRDLSDESDSEMTGIGGGERERTSRENEGMDLLLEADAKRVSNGTNPLEAIKESLVNFVEESDKNGRIIITSGEGGGIYGAPDVIRRNLMTELECQELFNL